MNSNCTLTKQKFYIYGLALHCATDIFAHSAWNEATGAHVLHPSADNVSVLTGRYNAALKVAENVVSHAYFGTVGFVTDFHISTEYFVGFKLINFAKYVQLADNQRYQLYRSYYDSLSYNLN